MVGPALATTVVDASAANHISLRERDGAITFDSSRCRSLAARYDAAAAVGDIGPKKMRFTRS